MATKELPLEKKVNTTKYMQVNLLRNIASVTKRGPPPSPSLATRLIYIAFIKNFCSFFWAIFKDSVFFKSNAIISYDSSISEKGFDCISK